MVRYTEEQKANALKRVDEVGVAKAKDELGISSQTLYKWKHDAGSITEPSKPKKRAKKLTTDQPKAAADTQSEKIEVAKALLAEPSAVEEKLAQLEVENAKLRETNARLRTALAAFID